MIQFVHPERFMTWVVIVTSAAVMTWMSLDDMELIQYYWQIEFVIGMKNYTL